MNTRMELAEKGIRVNSLSPGLNATGGFAKFVGMSPDEADDHSEYAGPPLLPSYPRGQPLQYAGRVHDMAQAALFLASDASRYITGRNMVVDGGITQAGPSPLLAPTASRFSAIFRPACHLGQIAGRGHNPPAAI